MKKSSLVDITVKLKLRRIQLKEQKWNAYVSKDVPNYIKLTLNQYSMNNTIANYIEELLNSLK